MKEFSFKIQKLFRILPFILIAVAIVFYFSRKDNINVEQIINYTPQNYFLAVISILGLYAMKSLSIVFPIPILYVSTGIIFPPFWAVIVNVAGTAVALSIPFLIGEFSGYNMTMSLVEKYPMLQKMNLFKNNNEWFFVFLLRMVGFLPMDIVSIFLGSIETPFMKHMTASIIAMLPNLLAVTFIGATVDEPGSPGFIIACIAKVVITILSVFLYKTSVNKQIN